MYWKSTFSQNMFHRPLQFFIFFIEKIFFYFRDFLSDLEIAETFENGTADASIRSRNLRLKKYADFFQISSDIYK